MRLLEFFTKLDEAVSDSDLMHWVSYAGHRDFKSEEDARRLIASKANNSIWTMGMDNPQEYYAQLAQEMPVYKTKKGWRIGTPEALEALERKREEKNRFSWDKVDYLDVDWTSIFSIGLLNQFDIDHIDGPDLVPLNEITPVEKIDQEHAESIAIQIKDGLDFRPIVLDASGAIVDGHHRYEAARVLGMKDIPAYVAYTHDDMLYEGGKKVSDILQKPYTMVKKRKPLRNTVGDSPMNPPPDAPPPPPGPNG